MPAVASISASSLLLDDDDQFAYPSVYTLNGLVHVNERHSLDNHSHYPSASGKGELSFSIAIDSPDGRTTITSSLCSVCPPRPSSHLRYRSLVDPIILCDEMTAPKPRDLSPPPGLTDSKSSSFHSSSLSDTESVLSDITHFEDISLEKEANPRPTPFGHDTAKRSSTIMNGGPKSASITASLRELTVGDRRQSTPTLHGSNRAPAGFTSNQGLGLSLPKGFEGRKGYRTSSANSLARRAMSNHSRSRSPSPSPSAPKYPPMLTKSATINLAPDWHTVQPPLRSAPLRRGSWTPKRKTAKELEKEYDDLDEELPEDASLWNVPISPRPQTSENMSPFPFSTSPEKSSPAFPPSRRPSAIRPPPSPRLPTNVPVSTTSDAIRSSSHSPIKPSHPVRGMSTGTMPDYHPFAKVRAKSWTIAMSELSEEAKDLTAALESLADKSGHKQEQGIHQRKSFSQRPSMDKKARSATSVELPPLRTNNALIDPLPVSKEKEKVLSRTRPSWLPPKSQKEEKKHLKEYQRMMEMSLQAGKSS